ncbi:hypothetical protein TrispH2_006455 [Trichoplax sp. H2]|nr:hypothetical protein TrispH2_006455 [Trichoplax sp. H2]|eukprot:RDD42182.1 hypothetical protein TrispH2_006455 [Trichoplax sp. H2]
MASRNQGFANYPGSRIGNHLLRDHPMLIHLLAHDLDAYNVAVSDWRSLGSRLGLPFDDIMSYENCKSPTTAMLSELSVRYSITIIDVVRACHGIHASKALRTIYDYEEELQEPVKPIIIIVYTYDCESPALGLKNNICRQTHDRVDVRPLVYDNGFALYDSNRRIWDMAQTIIFICSEENLKLYRAHHPLYYLSKMPASSNSDLRIPMDNEMHRNKGRNPRFSFVLCNGACPQDFMEVFGVRHYIFYWQSDTLIKNIHSIENYQAPAIGPIVQPRQIQDF